MSGEARRRTWRGMTLFAAALFTVASGWAEDPVTPAAPASEAAPVASARAGGAFTPGDLVYVEVLRHPELSTTAQVDANGNVNVPYIGNVNVAGLNEADAGQRLTGAMTRILKNPRVTVSRSAPVTPLAAPYRKSEMRTELVPLKNGNAEQLCKHLQSISSEGGSVTYDPDTNCLIVTDSPTAIQNILSVIQRLDEMQNQLTQVRIEAKIAEIQSGAIKNLGVRWFVQGQDVLGGYYSMPTQTALVNSLLGDQASPQANEQVGDSNGGSGNSRRFVNDLNFDRRLNAPVQVPKIGQLFLGGLTSHVDVGVMLDALMADNKAELLANPSILTVNHKRAEIRSTEEQPYTEFGTDIGGRSTFSTRFLDTGIKLFVTPHVYEWEGGTCVRLELNPEVSYVTGTSNGVPIRSVRSSVAEARVRDGQTLVVGGITRNDYSKSVQKVPGFGDVPVLGALFKRTEKTKTQTDLMVFVTPTVHNSPDTVTWDRMLDLTNLGTGQAAAVAPPVAHENRKD